MSVTILDGKGVPFDQLPEINLESGMDVLRTCYTYSEERWVGLADGQIACLWGLIPPSILSDRAYLWLYHNELVNEHKFAFVRHSQRQVQIMLEHYPTIIGDCLIGNRLGRRWLEWLGASFGDPKEKFIPFKIKAKHG